MYPSKPCGSAADLSLAYTPGVAAPCLEIHQAPEAVFEYTGKGKHGTAIVVAAAVLNGLEVAQKTIETSRFVVCGAGAVGMACADLLTHIGVEPPQIVLVDSQGIVHRDRRDLTPARRRFALHTTHRSLDEALVGADVFIGVSRANVLTGPMIMRMATRPLILALANPKLAAARALAQLARRSVGRPLGSQPTDPSLTFGPDSIIPKPFDLRVVPQVAAAVAMAAAESGVARQPLRNPDDYVRRVAERIAESVTRGQKVAC